MPRTAGKKFVDKLEADLVEKSDLGKISKQVEEKFSQVRLLPTDEELVGVLDRHTVRRDKENGSNKPHNKQRMNLPEILQAMPEGEEKKKRITAAAQAALLLGQPVGTVAAQYGLPHSLVGQWAVTVGTAQAVGRRDRLSDMIMIYIEQEFKSLLSISIATSDDRWIRKQDASSLANYIAVKSDRLLMLLQAFSRVETSRSKYVDQLEPLANNNG